MTYNLMGAQCTKYHQYPGCAVIGCGQEWSYPHGSLCPTEGCCRIPGHTGDCMWPDFTSIKKRKQPKPVKRVGLFKRIVHWFTQ